jgi:hypothetical protein
VKRSAAIVAAAAAALLPSPAVAAPPVLVSASHVDRHPEATWTLPPGVTSQVAEVATSPATSTDGYFFSENVKAIDILERAQTHWVYNLQLDPGTYYLHIAGLDEPCFFAGLCPVREFTQTATLVIAPPPPPPPPPPPRPRYEASVRSIHPGARSGSAGTGPTSVTLSVSASARESAALRRGVLQGLLHAQPPPRVQEPKNPRALMGRLAAADHARDGRLSRWPASSALPRVHVAGPEADCRPEADQDLLRRLMPSSPGSGGVGRGRGPRIGSRLSSVGRPVPDRRTG